MAVATGHVVLSDLEKRFDDVAVVRGIDLDIAPGEFFSLLGPSGCGKTTTLRIIGGFERPDRGSVWIDSEEVTDLAPEHRPVNTVFQSYALFPHLTVERNVAFGLRLQKVPTDEVATRVARALALVELGGLEGRRPHQLSGGQQQRVALARALILEPRVLLLDEPLGALDARLRKALQVELRSLQQAIGITFVYVTHDQEEALTMSDRLAVMDEGRLMQVGTPREVYEEPIDGSVADFLGVTNLLDVEHLGEGRIQVGDRVLRATGDGPVGRCRVVIRPERVRLIEGEPDNGLPVVVERRVFTGATTQVHLRSGDLTFHALVANSGGVAGDGATHAEMPVDALRLLAS